METIEEAMAVVQGRDDGCLAQAVAVKILVGVSPWVYFKARVNRICCSCE
jgi:hypothetical protein